MELKQFTKSSSGILGSTQMDGYASQATQVNSVSTHNPPAQHLGISQVHRSSPGVERSIPFGIPHPHLKPIRDACRSSQGAKRTHRPAPGPLVARPAVPDRLPRGDGRPRHWSDVTSVPSTPPAASKSGSGSLNGILRKEAGFSSFSTPISFVLSDPYAADLAPRIAQPNQPKPMHFLHLQDLSKRPGAASHRAK